MNVSFLIGLKMLMSDEDLNKMLQVQLSVQMAVATLLDGQRKIVEMIVAMCQKEKESYPKIKRCSVKIKRLKLTKQSTSKKKVKAK